MKKILCILLFALTLIVYSSAFNHEFVNWDDADHVTNNPLVTSQSIYDWPKHFISQILNQYIPLTTLSFAIEYFFFGDNPSVFHITNVILHAGVSVLIFLFALKVGISMPASFLGALIFSIHPMHVESVAWVTERKDVLYAFFYMLALFQYAVYLNNKVKLNFYWSLFWGLLSVLSKPMALSLPLICLLCDWYLQRKINIECIKEKLLYFIYIIPIAAITYFMHARVPGETISSSLLLWIWTAVFYIEKFIFFFGLSPYYVVPEPVSLANGAYIKGLLVFAAVILFIVRFRINRIIVFAGLFYFLSNFFMFKFDMGDVSVVADRYMYLPSVGFCLLTGTWIYNIKLGSKYRLNLVAGSLVLLLIIPTVQQIGIWRNSISLWGRVVEEFPQSAKGYANRGGGYLENGQLELAAKDLNQAIKIDPNNYKALANRGLLHKKIKNYDLAISDLTKAIEISPTVVEAYNNRGNVYKRMKNFNLALNDFNKALEFNRDNYYALSNRGAVYGALGQKEKAIEDFNRAIKLQPLKPELYYNRGLVLLADQRKEKALEDFNRALKLNPNYNAAAVVKSKLLN